MPHLSPDLLLKRVAALQAGVEEEGAAILARWDDTIVARGFLPAARNLAQYLALRQIDVSGLQEGLAAHGLSSLGRCEGRVMPTLQALHATLSRLAGDGTAAYPTAREFAAGAHTLERAQSLLFGDNPGGPRTRMMVTLPSEAAEDRKLVAGLVEAGMTCARINCAHDDADVWQAMARHVRAAAKKAKRDCRILMDVAGPKCRIETVHATGARLVRGDRITLVRSLADATTADAVIVTLNIPEVIDALVVGAQLWINDGKIGTRVVAHDGARVVLEVTSARAKGEHLRPEKGVNFPDTDLHLAPLTEKDLSDLDTVATLADLVGFSFVQRPEDIVRLHGELASRRPGLPPLPVMLKIETRLAVHNLPLLLVQAGGLGPAAVMIARGDLAVELGFARLSEMQEEIMWLAEAAHMPVVWATQVLESLVSDGMPTRAETTDAAMAQRAECVMLNKGPMLVEALGFLADVLHRMDRHQSKKSARYGALGSWTDAALRG